MFGQLNLFSRARLARFAPLRAAALLAIVRQTLAHKIICVSLRRFDVRFVNDGRMPFRLVTVAQANLESVAFADKPRVKSVVQVRPAPIAIRFPFVSNPPAQTLTIACGVAVSAESVFLNFLNTIRVVCTQAYFAIQSA